MATGRIASLKRYAATKPRDLAWFQLHMSLPGHALAAIARRAILDFGRRGLLVLGAEPIRLARRWRLISRRRRCQAFSRRLPGELGHFALVLAEGREHVAEEALGPELRGRHRTRALFRGRRTRGGSAAGRNAPFFELVRPQRPPLLDHRFCCRAGDRLLPGGLDLALRHIRILRPGRIIGDRAFAARRRQGAARRYHQRRALAVFDLLLAVALETKVLQKLAHNPGIGREVLLLGTLGQCAAAPAQRQRQGQCAGPGGSGAALPRWNLLPHGGYPLKPTAKCAAPQGVILATIGALLRHPHRAGCRRGGRSPRRRWPRPPS